jgi:hypothetical protein
MRLTGEEFYQFAGLVGDNPSVSVYITTSTQKMNLETYTPLYVTYQGILIWPESDVVMTKYNEWEFPDEGLLFTNLTGVD